MLRKNVASQILCFAGVNATTGAAITGATWTGRKCLDGTFSSLTATVTEDTGTGFYKVALAQADTNGNDCAYFFTATNAVPVCLNAITTAADPTDIVRFGLTALPNAAAEAAGGLYTRGTGTGQINQDANGRIDANVKAAAGTAVTLDANNVLNVSTKYVGGTLQTARDIGASVLLSSGTGTGQVSLSSGTVTVGTNNDKTGYSLTQAFPPNFSALSITAGGVAKADLDTIKTQTVTCAGGVTIPAATLASTTNITSASGITVSTNSDKTGYSLTQAFPSNFSAMSITVGGAVTAGTISDKTGYTLSAAGVDAIWDEVQSGHTTAGTFGKYLDQQVSTISGGGGGSGSGPGADQVTITITDPGTGSPIPDAQVWISSDAAGTSVIAGFLITNSSGQVTFMLDNGVGYYLWMQKDGQESIQGQAFTAIAD